MLGQENVIIGWCGHEEVMAPPAAEQHIHICLFAAIDFQTTRSQRLHAEQKLACPINTNASVAVYASQSHCCFNQLPTKQENHTLLSACFHCDLLSWLEKIESLFWDPQEPLEDTLCGQV